MGKKTMSTLKKVDAAMKRIVKTLYKYQMPRPENPDRLPEFSVLFAKGYTLTMNEYSNLKTDLHTVFSALGRIPYGQVEHLLTIAPEEGEEEAQ